MSGFRNKLAHSKLNLGPSDLKALTDLINSEKQVCTTTAKLSTDTAKSASSLREWSKIEGPDLDDVLSKTAFLFEQLSKAEGKYSEHVSTYRLFFKTLRTREENLITLKKSKDALARSIESAEKQLAKTSAEHKERSARESKLYELRQQMIGTENNVVNEEARLSDFKRETVREALALKLGALIELAEKTSIIGEMSRLLVAEVPQDRTVPGNSRAAYLGQSATDEVMQEAQNCLNSVVFNPSSSSATREIPSHSADTSFEPEQQQQTYLDARPASDEQLSYRTAHDDVTPSANAQIPQLPPFSHSSINLNRSVTPENMYHNTLSYAPPDVPESPGTVRHDSMPPPPLPPFARSQSNRSGSQGAFENRSSLAYMEGPEGSEPAPVAIQRGPPQSYDAANGLPRHGLRDEGSTSYDFEDNRHWARNNAVGSTSPARVAPVAMPEVPVMPPSIQAATVPDSPRQQTMSEEPEEMPSRSYVQPQQLSYSQQREYAEAQQSQEGSTPVPRQQQQFTSIPYQTSPSYQQQSFPSSPSMPQQQSFSPPPQQQQSTSRQNSPMLPQQGFARRDSDMIPPPSPRPLPEAPGSTRGRLSGPPPSNEQLVSPNEAASRLDRMPSPTSPSFTQNASAAAAAANRPRPFRGESALGSRHGYDDPTYKPAKDTNNLSQNTRFPLPNMQIANTPSAPMHSPAPGTSLANGGPPSGYSYHKAGEPPKLTTTASAFRGKSYATGGSGSNWAPSHSSGPSDAEKIRQAYMSQSAAVERQRTESMSREGEDQAGGIAEGTESTQPLRLTKSSSQDMSNRISAPPPYLQDSEPASVGYQNRYVTRLS